jgi:hypothetical protein
VIGLNEQTVGTIVGPDGVPLYRPTTLIGAQSASILRAYFYWAMKNHLEPELFCGNCWDRSRASKAQYNINEQEIEIVCGCALRVFFGGTLPPDPVAASQTQPVTDDTSGVGQVLLSEDAARLLRLYKKVLVELNLKEALRCNACYELEYPDGCNAHVGANSIQIVCRCSDRRYTGMTI